MYKSNVKITQGIHQKQTIVEYQVGDCAFQEISEEGFKKVTKIFNDGIEIKSSIVYQEERQKKNQLTSAEFEIFSEDVKKISTNFGVQHIFDVDGSITLKSLGKQDAFMNVPSITKITPDGNGDFHIDIVLKKMDLGLENFGTIQEKNFSLHTEKNSRVVIKNDEKGAVKEVIVDVGLIIDDEMIVLREEIKPNGHRVKKINGKPILIMKADDYDFVYQKSIFEYDEQGNSFETRQGLHGDVKKFKNNQEIKNEKPLEVELSCENASMDEKRKAAIEKLIKARDKILNNASSIKPS